MDCKILNRVIELHQHIRDVTIESRDKQSREELSRIAEQGSGDVVYGIDKPGEDLLASYCKNWVKEDGTSFVLVSEATGKSVFPANIAEEDAKYRIIVDPIDGTRPLMYDLDSAWVLTGVAPNKGDQTSLEDIEIAVQTEIPRTYSNRNSIMYAVRGGEVVIGRLQKGEIVDQTIPTPSKATTIAHGFAMLAKPFRAAKGTLGEIEERVFREILGPVQKGVADVFDDQYISAAGHMYNLITGKWRFVGDLRPLTEKVLNRRGEELGLCSHPYDLCTKLIAEQLGVIITDLHGRKLNAPLDTTTDVGMLGYANEHIRQEVEPVLMKVLEEYR